MKLTQKKLLAWALSLILLLGLLPVAAFAAEDPAELTATTEAATIEKY